MYRVYNRRFFNQYQCDITPLKYSTESRSRTNSVSVGYFF